MMNRKIALALLITGVLAGATPAFASAIPPILGDPGGASGSTPNQNVSITGTRADSGNGSNGSVGDNPDATATDDLCYRHTNASDASHTVCVGGRYLTYRQYGG